VAFLANYLSGSGSPIEVSQANVDSYFSRSNFLDETPWQKKSPAQQIRSTINSDLNAKGNKPNSTFKMTGVTDWQTRGSIPLDAKQAADVQTSLGKYSAKAVYEATYTTDSKGKVSSINVKYAPVIQDLYDFKANGQFYVQGDPKALSQVPEQYKKYIEGNGTRVTDDYFAQLSESGVAKPFYSWGVGSVRQTTIPIK
jgi:hypothetical protein